MTVIKDSRGRAPLPPFAAEHEELRETIARSDADLVLIGTPIDLRRIIELDKPAMRVTYRLQEMGEPTLAEILEERGLLKQTALV